MIKIIVYFSGILLISLFFADIALWITAGVFIGIVSVTK
jgi:hypothetical protein